MSDSAARITLDDLLAERRWVRALAARISPDASAADDLEQETWLAALRSPPPRAGSPRAWLATVVRNLARTAHRRSERRGRHEAFATPSRPSAAVGDVVAEAELHARLIRAVLELDEPNRSAVLLRFFRGLGPSEIAARQGVPVETVKTRLKRAIERLRERMGAEIGDDRAAWLLLVGGGKNGSGSVLPLSSAAAVGGGLAMAAGTKVVAAAVVLVVAGALWLVPRDGAPPAPTVPAPAVATSPAPARTATNDPRRHAAVIDDKTTGTTAITSMKHNGYSVHGRVIDDDTGAPVAGAAVSLVWELARQPGKEPTSRSAADGTFRIEGAVDGRFGDLFLSADGYAETIAELPWRDAATGLAKGDAGDVRIGRGKRVEGRVFAADGRTPVAGARIALSKISGGSGTMWFSHAKEFGRAGDDGRFALERVPPSPYAPYTLLAASADGVGWTSLPAVVGRADVRDVEVRLGPTGSVTVSVQNESGTPQADARVFASPRFGPLGPRSYGEPSDHNVWLPKDSAFAPIFGATTDAAGVARLTKLPIGDEGAAYDFVVHGRGAAWQDHVVVAAGEEKAITIVLVAPKLVPLVAGVRVVDGDGRPVEGATLTVVSGPRDAKATTDADGVAVVQRTQAAEQPGVLGWFDVAKEGFAKQNVGVRFVPDDATPLPTVTLVRPTPIEGRVVDQDGKPVAGCVVELRGNGADPSQPTTGADGRFSFPDATAGEWTLSARKPKPYDAWASAQDRTAVRGGDRDVVVVLRRLPVGNARVVATIVDADTGVTLSADDAWLIPAVQCDEPIRVADAKTDFGAGTVAFPRVRPGRWRLWVRLPGRGPAVATVDVAAGRTEVAVRVDLGRPAALRGRVELGDTGLAVPSMVIAASTDDWTRPEWVKTEADGLIGAARVQPDGTFRFPNVVPGRYRVWMEDKGFLGEGFADVPAGGEGEAVVTFVRGGVLSFRLQAPSPCDYVAFEISENGGPWRVLLVGRVKGKTFSEDPTLRPGTYRWRVKFRARDTDDESTAARMVEGESTVVAGETVVVDVPVVDKR